MLKKKTFLHFMIVALTLSVCLFFVCSCSDQGLTAKLLDSGDCGPSLKWSFYEDGTLIISGEGEMYDFSYGGTQWEKHKDDVLYITVENGVSMVSNGAFANLTNLRSVELADSVLSIGYGSFYGCSSLTAVKLSENLVSIGDRAFYECVTLSGVLFPDALSSIGTSAFGGCKNLKEITVPAGLTAIENKAFSGCISLKTADLPGKLKAIGSSAFAGCTGLESVTFPESLESIGYDAFSGCTSLKTLDLPGKLKEIGDGAFYGCTGLESVTFPESLESIEDWAFYGCTSLKTVVLPSKLKVRLDIDNVFSGCDSLTVREVSQDVDLKVILDVSNILGKTYGQIVEAYGEPSGINSYSGYSLSFDNGNFECGFENFINPDVMPSSDARSISLVCSLGYLIDGIQEKTYSFSELKTLLSDIDFELTYSGISVMYGTHSYSLTWTSSDGQSYTSAFFSSEEDKIEISATTRMLIKKANDY